MGARREGLEIRNDNEAENKKGRAVYPGVGASGKPIGQESSADNRLQDVQLPRGPRVLL